MSHRANPTLIGAFVVGAIALAVAGALILGGRQWFARPQAYVMFFDGSVAGLAVGAPVQYRGVPLGSVTAIQAVVGANQIAVFIGLDVSEQKFLEARTGRYGTPDVPTAVRNAVERGLRAQLQTQSLVTGQLYVAFDYFPGTPARLTGLDPSVPEIPTVPSVVEQASEQLKRLVARVEALPMEQLFTSTVNAVEAVRRIADSPQLHQALTSLDATVRDTRTLVVKLDAQVGPLAGSARQMLNETRAAVADLRGSLIKTVREIDKQIDPLVANTGQALDTTKALMLDTQRLVRETTDLVGPLAASATSTAEAARLTLEKAQGTLASADGVLAEETPLGYQLGQTLVELADAARALRVLADTLERQPSSLVFGKRPVGTR
jgi:phospholipid/cholesterol/gamma-HCH transport system substrate-binding protein